MTNLGFYNKAIHEHTHGRIVLEFMRVAPIDLVLECAYMIIANEIPHDSLDHRRASLVINMITAGHTIESHHPFRTYTMTIRLPIEKGGRGNGIRIDSKRGLCKAEHFPR